MKTELPSVPLPIPVSSFIHGRWALGIGVGRWALGVGHWALGIEH